MSQIEKRMQVFKTLQEAEDKLATIRGQDDACIYLVPDLNAPAPRMVKTIGLYNKQAGEWRVLCEDGSFDEPLPLGAEKTGLVKTSST